MKISDLETEFDIYQAFVFDFDGILTDSETLVQLHGLDPESGICLRILDTGLPRYDIIDALCGLAKISILQSKLQMRVLYPDYKKN